MDAGSGAGDEPKKHTQMPRSSLWDRCPGIGGGGDFETGLMNVRLELVGEMLVLSWHGQGHLQRQLERKCLTVQQFPACDFRPENALVLISHFANSLCIMLP